MRIPVHRLDHLADIGHLDLVDGLVKKILPGAVILVNLVLDLRRQPEQHYTCYNTVIKCLSPLSDLKQDDEKDFLFSVFV